MSLNISYLSSGPVFLANIQSRLDIVYPLFVMQIDSPPVIEFSDRGYPTEASKYYRADLMSGLFIKAMSKL